MDNPIYQDLHADGLISDNSLQNIRKKYSSPLFSLHWELKTLLYIGVMLLSAGLGILIYKNIDSISHQVVLIFIAAISTGCFFWCNKLKKPFDYAKVESPNSFFDYILLLGTLSFLTFVGYLQFQYEVFGTNYGLATFIPMVVLFFIAYYFDHLGILTLAIANLAIWMGVSVTPKDLLAYGTFDNESIIYTYLVLGYVLLAAAHFSKRLDIKKHFFFSYHHYGVHLAFIAILAGYFLHDFVPSLIWLVVFGITAWFIYKDAFGSRSYYFLLLVVLYGYVAISGLVTRALLELDNEAILYLGLMYFIGSAIYLIILLIKLHKKLKAL